MKEPCLYCGEWHNPNRHVYQLLGIIVAGWVLTGVLIRLGCM